MAAGIDPSGHRKATKALDEAHSGNSFEVIARQWFAKQSTIWAQNDAGKIKLRLENDLFSWVGTRAITEISAWELLTVLNRIVDRGALESTHRVLRYCSQIFCYAITPGRAERNPAADPRGALPPVKVQHHAALTEPKAIGALLRVIDSYEGSFVTKCALKLASLLFLRLGELRPMEWKAIDFESAQ